LGDYMHIYLDESGCEKAEEPFVVGIFCTWRPELWRDIVADQKRSAGFSGRLHFHRISNSPNDNRYLATSRIFNRLLKYKKTWYARFMYVSEDKLPLWHEMFPGSRDVYDFIVKEFLSRFCNNIPDPAAMLYLEKRDRFCDYIPTGLQEALNKYHELVGGPHMNAVEADPHQEILLQVSDALTSAIRQVYVPSTNVNKKRLAEMLVPLIDGNHRIKVWHWP